MTLLVVIPFLLGIVRYFMKDERERSLLELLIFVAGILSIWLIPKIYKIMNVMKSLYILP